MPETSYRDYGYTDPAQTWSHAYLWNVVSTLLPAAGRCPNGIIDLGCGVSDGQEPPQFDGEDAVLH